MPLKLRKLFIKFLKAKRTAFSSSFHPASWDSRINKTTLFVVLFFCLLGVTLPLYFAQAFLWEGIAEAMFAPIFFLIPAVGNLFLQLAFLILNWVTSEGFISWPYTIPGSGADGNPLIEVGWTLTRDLANMFLVIILIIIGLSTALKVGEYEIKKTLPRLIGIALLINFTPIIMGLIVDASNITMNFFLDKLSGFDVMVKTMTAQYSIVTQTMKSNGIIVGAPLAVFQAILLFIVDILAAFIVGLFAALFVIRHVAIWILVILSPIAFISSLLPSTKGFFKTWWTQFIQWSVIGVVAAFFLYLGNHILFLSERMIGTGIGSGEMFQLSFSNSIQSMMPIGVALIFLIFGFFMSLSTSAMGAGGVISFAQKQGRSLSSGAWKKAGLGKKISDRAGRAWEESGKAAGFRQRMTDLSKMSSLSEWGEGQSGAGGWMKRKLGGAANIATLGQGAAVLRATGRALGSEDMERAKKKIATAEKEVEGASIDMVISKFRSAGDWATKIGYINRLAKKGDIDEAIQKKGLKMQEVGDTMLAAKKNEQEKDIVNALPELEEGRLRKDLYLPPATAMPISTLLPGQRAMLTRSYKDEIISKIKPSQSGQISGKTLEHELIMEAIIQSWDGRHMSKFLETHGPKGIDAIEKTIIRTGGKAALKTSNPKLHKYLSSMAAQNLGFS